MANHVCYSMVVLVVETQREGERESERKEGERDTEKRRARPRESLRSPPLRRT